jgi:hypothetical protein
MQTELISRKDAIAIGMKHYFTGKLCKSGHVAKRLVSTCVCVLCAYESQQNTETVERKAKHYQNNKEKYLSRAKKRYEENRQELIEKACDYQKANLRKILKQRKSRMVDDDLYAIKERVRCLIKESIKKMNFSKNSKTSEILGCSKNEFKAHIEKQFLKGMTWGNRNEWHLDHIVPISTAKNQEDVIRLNHFTNLRPLWSKDNLSKSNKQIFLL